MTEIAVTKIWAIKERSKSSYSLKRVIEYAMNEDKTVGHNEKGDRQIFVTGVNCSAENALHEFEEIKTVYGKTDKVLAYHSYQSFAQNEVTPEECHRLGVETARRMWGDTVQVAVCTHLDKENHLHNHFVVNSVALDGHKLVDNEKNYYRMRAISDEVCRENGLSFVIPQSGHVSASKDKVKNERQQKYLQKKEQEKNSVRSRVRNDVDEVIENTNSVAEFIETLRRKGWVVKTGKHLSVFPPYGTVDKNGRKRSVRLKSLGDDYTEERIAERINFKSGHVSAFQNKKDTQNKKTKQSQKGIRKKMREEVDEIIENSDTVSEVLEKLTKEKDWKIYTNGNHIKVFPLYGTGSFDENGNEQKINLKSLGFNYTEEKIAERIYERIHADEIAEEERKQGEPPLYDWDKNGKLSYVPRKAKLNPDGSENGESKVETVQAMIFVMRFRFEKLDKFITKSGHVSAFQKEYRKIEKFFRDFKKSSTANLIRQSDIDYKAERKKLNDFVEYSAYLSENKITKLSQLDRNAQIVQDQIKELNINRIKLRKELRKSDDEVANKELCDEIAEINEQIQEKRRLINMFKRIAETNTELKNLTFYLREKDYESKQQDTKEQIEKADKEDETKEVSSSENPITTDKKIENKKEKEI